MSIWQRLLYFEIIGARGTISHVSRDLGSPRPIADSMRTNVLNNRVLREFWPRQDEHSFGLLSWTYAL
jgi:hypothetical protein